MVSGFAQQIRVGNQGQGQGSFGFLDFVGRNKGWPVIRNGRRKNQKLTGIAESSADLLHLNCSLDAMNTDPGMTANLISRSVDQLNMSTAVRQDLGQRDSHPSRRTIADVTDGVQGLTGGASRNQDSTAFPQRFSDQEFSNPGQQGFGFGHAAFAHQARCQLAVLGGNHVVTAFQQGLNIGRGGRVQIHVVVHGRRKGHRTSGREHGGQ